MMGGAPIIRATRRRRRLQPGINLVPMLDMVFNLLFFFLLATDFRQSLAHMEVRLPSAAPGQPAATPEEDATITLDAESRIYYRDREVVPEELDLELHVLAAKGTTRIVVRGDERVNYGKVVEVMNRCKAAGLTEVQLDLRPM